MPRKAEYSVEISYGPQYTTITKAQKVAIEKRKKAYDELMKEVTDFIDEQEIETTQRKPSISLMHTIWDNDNIIQSLTRTKVSSETIAVVKNNT